MTQLQAALAKAVAANPELAGVLAGLQSTGKKSKKTKAKGRTPLTDEQRAEFAAKNDAECIKAFTKAGYKDVQPRVNVLTYGKVKLDGSKTGWLSHSRTVKKGQKAVRVGPFNLFHIDQTEEVPANAVAA